MESLDFILGLDSAIGELEELFAMLFVLLAIPSLLNCFFGYKIQKFFITLSGVATGGIIGLVIGALAGGDSAGAVAAIMALLMAVLGGFLAFKLYRLGIFLTFWLYGTVLFAVLFLAAGGFEMIPVAVVLGLIIGVLALVLHKGFIICMTAISGGISAGMLLGGAIDVPALGFLLGAGLSALGIFVQFRMEKKKERTDPAQNTVGAAAVQNTAGEAAVQDAAVPPERPAASAAPEKRFQPLGTTVPTTYCPRGGVLVDACTLSKDNDENVFAAIDFRNAGGKPVIAVYYTLLCRSVGGDELGSVERVLLDLNAAPGAKFSSGEPFQLPDHTTRLIDVRLTQVVTAGGESIRLTEEDNKPLPRPQELRGSLSAELLELAGIGEDERSFLTELENGLWICTCGTIAGETCPRCGRARGSVLRDNGSDIYVRVNDRIKAELSRSENLAAGLTAKRELTAARDAISRDRELLQGFENLKELAGDCDRELESIGERLSEIASREEKMKKKAGRYALLAGIAAGCVAVLALAVSFVRGLPPSDGRVRKDMLSDITENYGNYKITRSVVEDRTNSTSTTWKEYRIELWGEDKVLHDELYATTYLNYEKEGGAFHLFSINTYTPVITPAEKPSPSDSYVDLIVHIKTDDEFFVISDSGNSWELLSDGIDPSELSYSCELDYAGAELNENVARIPASFQVSYRNAEGELDGAIEYTYRGNRVWQADPSNPLVEVRPRGDVMLTHESLAAILKDETILYKEEPLSGEYLTLKDEDISYTEGYQRAAVTAGFAWDDGEGSFDGILAMELEYTSGQWHVTSVSYPEASHPAPKAAMTKDEAAELLRAAVEADGTIKGEAVELTIDEFHEADGVMDLTGRYVVRDGQFLRSTVVTGSYEYHAGQGWQLNGRPVYGNVGLRPERDISDSLSTHYRLITSGTVPVGIAGSGSAQATVNINTSGDASVTLNIGGLRVNLLGGLYGPTPTISGGSAGQNILVRYTLFLTTEAEINYYTTGDLRYENGMLRGTLDFITAALGVDNFSVALGD